MDRRIFIEDGGEQTRVQSKDNDFSFKSTKIGPSELEIKEVAGKLSLDGIDLGTMQIQLDANTLAIVELDKILANPPIDEELTVNLAGQTVFNAAASTFNPSDAVYDILVLKDGRKQTQGVDFNKTSNAQLTWTSTLYTGKITIFHLVPYLYV